MGPAGESPPPRRDEAPLIDERAGARGAGSTRVASAMPRRGLLLSPPPRPPASWSTCGDQPPLPGPRKPFGPSRPHSRFLVDRRTWSLGELETVRSWPRTFSPASSNTAAGRELRRWWSGVVSASTRCPAFAARRRIAGHQGERIRLRRSRGVSASRPVSQSQGVCASHGTSVIQVHRRTASRIAQLRELAGNHAIPSVSRRIPQHAAGHAGAPARRGRREAMAGVRVSRAVGT
jgi:hypothetical protein